MNEPKVAILMPMYKERAPWAINTLKSIMENAGYENYEVIVIDDGELEGSDEHSKVAEFIKNVDWDLSYLPKVESHGSGRARNRGLHFAEGSDVVISIDSHMVFSKDWVKNLVKHHLEHPDAIIQGTGVGARDIKVLETIYAGGDKMVVDANKLYDLKEKYKEYPLILRLPISLLAKRDGSSGVFRDTVEAMAMYDLPVNWHNKSSAELAVLGHNLRPDVKASYYGAELDYDPEDRNFITPKWSHYWRATRPPMDNLERLNGLMGACYLVPRQLMLDRFGGWPQWHGWIHEEPYLCIAAAIQKIPIYLTCDVIAAHNYDRPHQPGTNMGQIEANRQSITEICFDDMKDVIQKEIFGDVVKTVFPDWVYEYREKVQAGRKISDEKFLHDTGLKYFFIPKYRELAIRRLGTMENDLRKAGQKDVAHAIDSLMQNPILDWMWFKAKLCDNKTIEPRSPEGPARSDRRTTMQLVCATTYDTTTNSRSNTIDMLMHSEMLGETIQELLNQYMKMCPRPCGKEDVHNTGIDGGDNVAVKP